mmetsp:Transcript_1218/g.1280  ORF Transcript_1218/g.1280 Transcript_1218/m.1280 type:complete len:333 (+) Transcript_1218:37-1035(+)
MKKFMEKLVRGSTAAPAADKAFDKFRAPKKSPFFDQQGVCEGHDTEKFPMVMDIERCISCNIRGCYMCSHDHFDKGCNVEWGHRVFDDMKMPDSDKNVMFNQGYVTKLSLKKLKCPCGKPFVNSPSSTICSACGTATCSVQCHEKYVRSRGLCVFYKNFTFVEETKLRFNGLFSVQWHKIRPVIKTAEPGTLIPGTSRRFMITKFGQEPLTLDLQRGFRQYGQPHEETLEHMEVQPERVKEFNEYEQRMCSCMCSYCSSLKAHPVHNCRFLCETQKKSKKDFYDREERLNQCHCQCYGCQEMAEISHRHSYDDCKYRCISSPYFKYSEPESY